MHWTTMLFGVCKGLSLNVVTTGDSKNFKNQGIAYAVVAGLEPQYGLYSAFMGCFAYCIFGRCSENEQIWTDHNVEENAHRSDGE